ncbi:uncharacterized protein PRCAT00000772001 [Priceomyces carsonii]|uniref:uncharacterized protein n=1 Tax=Priceomyces carsonii TaxID=28549 RepID=UPI002ED87929|nr:unnamed protein product [Priceomyces carsonii]
MGNDIHPVREVTYGAISGVMGKLIEFPFDTIKVRLQSSSNFSDLSTWQTIKRTYSNEGIVNGFYRGLKAPLLGACLENAVLFFSYNYATALQLRMKHQSSPDSLSLASKCLSGGFSGFMASFVLTPVELVKCNLQVANLSVKETHSYGSVVKQIVNNHGIAGLWKGLSSTLLREVGGTAIWFGTYEFLIGQFKKRNQLNDWTLLVSGALAGVCFNFSTFPFDTIKSNIQTNHVLKKNHSGFWKTAAHLMAKKGGAINFYNGLSITLIRAIPANALIFYSYELLKRNFK